MSDSIQRFNITTPKGRSEAIDWFDKHGWMLSSPIWTLWKAGNFLWNAATSATSDAVEKEIEAQKKAAIDIIKAGKENGVDELEITMSEKAGLSLGSGIKEFPVELIAGTSGNMTLKVKYRC